MGDRQNIWFFNEGINFRLREKGTIRTWIRKIVRNEGLREGEINFIFCSDEYLLEINLNYLKNNTLTDIVTFSMAEGGSVVGGDVYISIERARENARKFGVRVNEEIKRLIVHGVLHLAGYEDKTPEEKRAMTQKEDYYLSLPAN